MRCQTHPLKPPQLVTPFLSRSTKDKLPSSLSHLPHAAAFDHDPQLSFSRVPCVRVCFMPFNIENYWRCFRTLESEWVATLMVLSACVAFIAVTCLLSSFTCPTLMVVVVANLPFVSRKGHYSFGTRRWQTMWWNHILLMHPSHSRLDSLTEKDEHL